MTGALRQERAERLLALYREIHTPKEWWREIVKTLDGYPWSSSIFSPQDFLFLEQIGCPAYKIASFELCNLDLIRACASTSKPLTVSVNYTATADDVANAARAAMGAQRITFLHATRYYDSHNDYLKHLDVEKERFFWLCTQVPPYIEIGISDHSPPGTYTLQALAYEKEAYMLERHLCLPGVKTPDSAFSLTPLQMRRYINRLGNYARRRKRLETASDKRRVS